jgi:hypothetical protein
MLYFASIMPEQYARRDKCGEVFINMTCLPFGQTYLLSKFYQTINFMKFMWYYDKSTSAFHTLSLHVWKTHFPAPGGNRSATSVPDQGLDAESDGDLGGINKNTSPHRARTAPVAIQFQLRAAPSCLCVQRTPQAEDT